MDFTSLFSEAEKRLLVSLVALGLPRDQALELCTRHRWSHGLVLSRAADLLESGLEAGAEDRSGAPASSPSGSSGSPRTSSTTSTAGRPTTEGDIDRMNVHGSSSPPAEPEPEEGYEGVMGYLLYKAPANWRRHLGLYQGRYAGMVKQLPEDPTGRLQELRINLVRVWSMEEAERLWAMRHRIPLPLHRHCVALDSLKHHQPE